MSKVFSSKAIIRVIILLITIVFGIFLYNFNGIEKVELVKTDGITYEKVVVTEILSDNIPFHSYVI